jgi:hypothetical protein
VLPASVAMTIAGMTLGEVITVGDPITTNIGIIAGAAISVGAPMAAMDTAGSIVTIVGAPITACGVPTSHMTAKIDLRPRLRTRRFHESATLRPHPCRGERSFSYSKQTPALESLPSPAPKPKAIQRRYRSGLDFNLWCAFKSADIFYRQKNNLRPKRAAVKYQSVIQWVGRSLRLS